MSLYDVSLDGNVIGNVSVTAEGLYTGLLCQCKLPDGQIYRLVLNCNGQKHDLGICVPTGQYYTVNKRVPSKQIGQGEMKFYIVPKYQREDTVFVPISSNARFAYIRELEKLRLIVTNENYGCCISDHPTS